MNKIEEAIVELKKKLYNVKEVFAVILYGSTARGDYSIRHSDIDILIILEDIKAKNKIENIIDNMNIKYRVRLHPEYQLLDIKHEDQTLLCKMFEEGKLLFSKGFWFIGKERLGLDAFRLYKFDTTDANKTNRVILSRVLHGRDKRYKGLIDDISVIGIGKGGLLVKKNRFSDIEGLFKRLKIKYKIKKTIYG